MANPIDNILAELAQNSRYVAAMLRQLGDGAQGAINGFYREARRYVQAFDENRGFRYRPATILLGDDILGAGTAASGSDSYRISANEDFLVQSIRGVVGLKDLTSEPQGATAYAIENATGPAYSVSPSERLRAKANNCFFQLRNKDTKVDIIENLTGPLSSICPEAGGEVMVFGPNVVPGFIIPHGVTMEATFALQSANAFFNTANTFYGVALTGLYLSRER